MTTNPTPPSAFIGCDVGKTAIAVFDSRDGRIHSIPNQPDSLAAFAATLDPTCFVVCEATGGYEATLLSTLLEAGCPAHRADARKVKAFIRSFGILGKTDAIDARALARYAQERHQDLPRWQATDPDRATLQTLVLTRRDIVDQRVAFKNRLSAPCAIAVSTEIKAILAIFDAQIKAIDAKAEAIVKTSQPLETAVTTLRTIKGIGLLTAVSLLALMPELGTINRRQAAALAGLAPHPSQSGTRDGYRRTKGGRPEIKKLLFMTALTASRHDPDLSAFYQRLLANGKKPMLAIGAVMRKIIVICNARLQARCQPA